MANFDAVTKVLSREGSEAIVKIVEANPSSEVFDYIEKKFDEAHIDNTYTKKLHEAYKLFQDDADKKRYRAGVQTPIDPDLSDVALFSEVQNCQLKESLSYVNVDIRFVEENNDIGQERQIPVAIYLGAKHLSIDAYARACGESLESCYLKVLGTWSDWLRRLGLDYNYEKSTIIDIKTGKVPSKEEFESRINKSGDDALNLFIEKAKKNGLLQKNGEIIVTYAALDFNNRQRATPVSP